MTRTRHSGPPRYLLVANPSAQSGRAQRWIAEASADMRAMGMGFELMHTEPEGRTVEVLAERLRRDDIDTVIYLGGDGTFHEVATGILRSERRLPLGLLPSGTANDQGLSFGIHRGEIDRNLAVVAAGHITELDVGRIEQRDHAGSVTAESYFFDSCGFGMHPDILAARNRHCDAVRNIPIVRDLYRDQAVYFGATLAKLLESYLEPVKFRAEVVCDGKHHVLDGLTDLIISATPVYGGAWVLDRHAKPDDGIFELAPIQGRRDWASKAMRDLAASPIWQEQLDKLGLTHSQGMSGSVFELDLYRPERGELLAQVDGDSWGAGDRYRVTVLPRLLSLITPADFVPPWQPR